MSYLTENAEKNVETILSVSRGVGLLTGSNKVSVFIDRISEFEWSVNEILKGSESAKAILGFAIRGSADEIEGTLQLTLIKEDKEWRIDGVDMPKFTKFSVGSSNAKS